MKKITIKKQKIMTTKDYKRAYSYEIGLMVKERNEDFKIKQIKSSKDAEEYARQFYFDDLYIFESIFILFLNRKNEVRQWAKISQGGTTASIADIKIIIKLALDTLAQSVVLIHNHPSGNLTPSVEDENVTNKVKNALKYLDILVLDHIILAGDKYYSFADNGII